MDEKRTIVRLRNGDYKFNTKLTEKQINFLRWLNDHNLLKGGTTYRIEEQEEEFEEP